MPQGLPNDNFLVCCKSFMRIALILLPVLKYTPETPANSFGKASGQLDPVERRDPNGYGHHSGRS
jgi:hypothetical protein